MQKTMIPQRASKLAAPVTVDVEQEYDDTASSMPRSAIRYRSSTTQPTQPQTRTTDVLPTPVTTRRVSGGTRFLLWVVLVLGVTFLFNGLVMPAVQDALTQLKYGDSRISTYDLNGRHFITEETNGRIRIVVSNPDGSHNQVLTNTLVNAPKHALVSLKENGSKIDVSVNDAYITSLLSDGNNGYKWGSN